MADSTAVAAVQEGSRWRYARPSSTEVKDWFSTQILDEGMDHDDYLSGVVVIPANEKVKQAKVDGDKNVVEEIYELTFTPYVRIDMRVLYFRRYAERNNLIRVVEPVEVPRIADAGSAYFNAHMAKGFWWHVVSVGSGPPRRYLVSTHRVALYEREPYTAALRDPGRTTLPVPILEGIGSKQVNGGADDNAIMKAETGAIGRALGVAGILVVGTGIATAEDMIEATAGPQAAGSAQIPEGGPGMPAAPLDPAQQHAELRERALALQGELKGDHPEAWREFAAWWKERQHAEGWADLNVVPMDPLRGIVSKMERMVDTARRAPDPVAQEVVGDGDRGADAPTGG